MSKLHYTELFYSLQGEGRYMGVPSLFLRTFGCNFRCKNFGRYEQDILGIDETHNPEVIPVIKNINQYKSFNDLPLAKTGCDSYGSIYPEFKRFAIKETSEELVSNMIAMLPYKEWRDEHLVITGGEPLLGWQRSYPDLLDDPRMIGLKELTFETNGTQPLSENFKDYLKIWTRCGRSKNDLTFSVSAKLSCSGEAREEAIRPEIVVEYEQFGYVYLKFVVATEEDVAEALEVTDIYRAHGLKGPVYLMPVGGTETVYQLNKTRVAELAIANGLRYSDRLQVPLFKNAWGT